MGDGRDRDLALHGAASRPVAGGIIGAFLASVAGALVSGYLLPTPGVPTSNPPGIQEALWPLPGTLVALAAAYAYGARRGDEPLR